MLKATVRLWVTAGIVVLWVPGTIAQVTEQLSVPKPPLPMSLGSDTSTAETGTQEVTDTSGYVPALSGAEDFTPGRNQTTRSFLLPSMNVYQWADSNPFLSPHPDGFVALSSIFGKVLLRRNFGRSSLTVDYAGGGTIANRQVSSPTGIGLNSIVQEFETTQITRWRRFAMLFSDEFRYSPEASFGSMQGGMNNFDLGGDSLGGSLPDIRSFLTPDQSILTVRGGRVSNTFVTQGEYDLSARSSITAAGAYDVLRFFDSGLFDISNAMFMAGYNHQVSRTNSFGVIYRFNTIQFANLDRTLDDHVAQLSYGRRITGRLALQISSGPEVGVIRSAGIAPASLFFWNAESVLHYDVGRTTLDLSYSRELTGGAGVLAGAETSRVEATANKGLSRAWQGSFRVGYAKNRSVGTTSTSTASETFDSWYGGVQFSRSLGRTGDIFAGYLAQLQTSNVAVCASIICAESLTRHQIYVGFNWRHRPIAMK